MSTDTAEQAEGEAAASEGETAAASEGETAAASEGETTTVEDETAEAAIAEEQTNERG